MTSVDHLCVGDHVSFFIGAGSDGLITATSLLATQAELPVYIGLYLLPLRHPVPVARQLATIAELAPGRLTLGVGIGGEDRHEVEVCGVDPKTRGRRMGECLRILRGLADGTPLRGGPRSDRPGGHSRSQGSERVRACAQRMVRLRPHSRGGTWTAG